MQSSYDDALRRLLADEGGYTNDPRDPGGATNYGITIFDFRKYIDPLGTDADVRHMLLSQAKAIYKAKYWDAIKGDELPAGIDYATFDFGVNSGVSRAVKYLQRIVGTVMDGVVGPKTLDACARADAADVAAKLCEARLQFLKSLGTWGAFGHGWGRRVVGVRACSIELAHRQTPRPVPVPTPAPTPIPAPAPKPPVAPQPRGLAALFAALIRFFTKGIR